MSRGVSLIGLIAIVSAMPATAVAAPEGTVTWGLHVTLASRWLDPAETEALATPFMVLYAVALQGGQLSAGRRFDQGVSVLGAVRGREAEEAVGRLSGSGASSRPAMTRAYPAAR